MNRRARFFVLAALLALAGCGDDGASSSRQAPVVNLGLHSDSATGAMTVRAGDTLWDIARRYRLPVREIIDINGIEPPYAISDGQRLKLPPPMDYAVRSSDTVYSIAQMFGVSLYKFTEVNNLREPYSLRPGQSLRIPSSYRKPEMASAAPLSPPSRRGEQVKSETVTREALPPPRKQASHQTVASSAPLPRLVKPSAFRWPVRGKIISGYGPKAGGLYNEGINIAAPRGTAVAAAADGVVAYVGNDLKSYGNLVLIRHGGGMMTAYAHLGAVRVKKGIVVHTGQSIGSMGSTGAVPVAQLHFEVRQGAQTLDPEKYL